MEELLKSILNEIKTLKYGQKETNKKLAHLEYDTLNIKLAQTSDRELLELAASQIGKLTVDIDGVKSDMEQVKTEVVKTNMAIEHDLKPKAFSLFDGYNQNA